MSGDRSPVDIGERSGMGLADLYGHWKEYSLPEPVIAEEYDPDRVKITVYTDSGQDPTNTRPIPDQSAQECSKNGPRCPKTRPRPDQDPTKIRPRPDQLHGLICRHHAVKFMKL